MSERDYYLILEVAPDASQDEIKKQYHFLLQAWHPDKFSVPDQKAKAQEKAKLINEAYATLRDPYQRAKYDRERTGTNTHGSKSPQEKHEQQNKVETQRRRAEYERQRREKAETERRQAEYERQANMIIERVAKSAVDYFHRAVVYQNRGKLDQAIADFTKAIELDPNDAETYCNRGIAYSYQGKFDQAIADYTKTIELDPDYDGIAIAIIYRFRGTAYLNQGKLDQAIADFTKAIELNPNDAETYCKRGIAYRAEGLKTEATADLKRCLALAPNAIGRTQVEQWLRELN